MRTVPFAVYSRFQIVEHSLEIIFSWKQAGLVRGGQSQKLLCSHKSVFWEDTPWTTRTWFKHFSKDCDIKSISTKSKALKSKCRVEFVFYFLKLSMWSFLSSRVLQKLLLQETRKTQFLSEISHSTTIKMIWFSPLANF